MDYAEVKQQAEKIIIPVVEALGYEVVEVQCKYYNKANNITVFIHKQGGITLNDCETVSKALDAPLEAADITHGATYMLNVSSSGLDRPIVTDKDYTRNLGVVVEATFKESSGKKKKVIGSLDAYDDTTLTLGIKTTKQTLKRDEIKVLRPHIDFKSIK